MHKAVFLLLTTSLLFGQLAFADESKYDIQMRKEFNMPPEWFTCKVTRDCGLVSIPCMASLSVSFKYKNAAQGAILKKFGPFMGCDASMIDISSPLCSNGQCVTIPMTAEEEKQRFRIGSTSPGLKLKFVGFGCVQGFGGWIEPPKNEKQEFVCDEENLKQFETFLGRCNIAELNKQEYDLDKDGCVTCQDYFMWKKRIKHLYKLHKRSTDGKKLIFKPCDNK